METITYEEDLQKNPFFTKLMERISLLQEISCNGWIVACPRHSSFTTDLQSISSNHEFMLTHILSPSEELPRSHFINLIGDEVIINERVIKLKNHSNTSHQCNILFEEFFYTKDLQKFKIICIDKPINPKFISKSKSFHSMTVANVQDSYELIHQNCSKQVERKIDNAIKNFNLRMQKSFDYKKFHTNIKLLFDYCINVTCNRKLIKDDAFLTMNMKIAMEYIIMDAVYDKIFDAIAIEYAEECQKFNKIMRKLANIKLSDLNVSVKVHENLHTLKIEMLKINSSRNSLDKLSCIKNVIDSISAMNKLGEVTTTDELIPILVYLTIKSGYLYWLPTLMFIKEFNLSQVLSTENGHSNGSALLYIFTTLEAIVYFIQTNEHLLLENNQLFQAKNNDEITCQSDYLNYIFQFIRDNDEIQFTQIFNIPYSVFVQEKTLQSTTCHPLCACSSCENIKTQSLANVNQSSYNGLTMLHIAAYFNAVKILTILLSNNATIDKRDSKGYSPLHYAAKMGHQKVLFLLMHSESNINLKTNNEETALILASMHGHEQCVKALLFFSEHTHISVDINAQDNDGMTALHYACQYGFDVIVDNLLEYQAKVTLKNHIGKMPVDYAYNSVIRKKLDDAAKYQVEELPVTENSYIFIRTQDLAECFDDNT